MVPYPPSLPVGGFGGQGSECIVQFIGPVVQLDRIPDSGSGGCAFESRRDHEKWPSRAIFCGRTRTWVGFELSEYLNLTGLANCV